MIDNERAIRHLLINTAGMPHGRFAEWQEDDDGSVWEFRDTVREEPPRELLGFLPDNREFVIYRADDTYIYALYRVNDRYHIMRAVGKRFYKRELRRPATTASAFMVRDTMKELYSHQLETDWHVNVA